MEGLTELLKKEKIEMWFKRLGWAGVIFFTVKGLIWLAIFLGLGKLIGF